MKRSGKRLRFPVGGLVKGTAYQDQPPFTTPDALNVRPTATYEGRERGGSRPGLDKAYPTELGSGNPVRLLAQVPQIRTDGRRHWTDNFEGDTLGSVWSTASWIGTAPSIEDESLDEVSTTGEVGAVRSAISDLDTSSAYRIELLIHPYQSEHWGSYSVFARMDSSSPDATTDGIVATLTLTGTGGAYSGSLTEYHSGADTSYSFTSGNDGYAAPGWFVVVINGNTITCTWRGTQVLSQAISAHSGSRFGFGIECTEMGGVCLVDTFRIQYNVTGNREARWNRLVASANGTLYREDWLGALETVSSSLSVADDRRVLAFPRGQVLYIADHGDYKVAESGSSVAANGTDVTDADVSDWSALSISTNDDVAVISDGTGSVTDGTYQIASVSASKLVLASSCGGSGTCSIKVTRGPKTYTPSTNTLALWTGTDEDVPTGCQLGCLYRDRAVLAAPEDAPHMWYMSRQGDMGDWDYSESDVTSATYGANAEAGRVGEPLTALAPYRDDVLVFGCLTSVWILRGDPNYGGSLDRVPGNVGIVSKCAWTWTPGGYFVFLSLDGLYGLAPTPGAAPESLSRKRLPRELRNMDRELFEVALEFDHEALGLHIFLTGEDARDNRHWWMDWESKSFWPVDLADDHEPTATLLQHSQDPESNRVLLGCRDGYLRQFHGDWEQDDGGTEIEAYVCYGPLRLGPNVLTEGQVAQLLGVLSERSGDVTWSVHVGQSGEKAVEADAFVSGTWTAGDNHTVRPHARGVAGMLKLENADSDRGFAIESVDMVVHSAGPRRSR